MHKFINISKRASTKRFFYKVVTDDWKSLVDSRYRLSYTVGEETAPLIGKIFVFSSLKAAKKTQKREGGRILLCEAVNPHKIRWVPVIRRNNTNGDIVWSFWQSPDIIDDYGNFWKGFFVCDKVRIIKEISGV